LPAYLEGCTETRVDIDPACNPDIVASITDLGEIGQFDIVLCSHTLEHVYHHEVPIALSEFRRVLVDGGHAVILVPDLEDVKPTNEIIGEAPGLRITGLDLIYGLSSCVAQSPHWAHKTGFTRQTLRDALANAGFGQITIKRIPYYNLLGTGVK
jgi:SAM-dependent methyltransferase